MVSSSNSLHPSTRLFRLGISRYKIDYGNPKVYALLRQKVSEHARVVLWDGEDRRWFDMIAPLADEDMK